MTPIFGIDRVCVGGAIANPLAPVKVTIFKAKVPNLVLCKAWALVEYLPDAGLPLDLGWDRVGIAKIGASSMSSAILAVGPGSVEDGNSVGD